MDNLDCDNVLLKPHTNHNAAEILYFRLVENRRVKGGGRDTEEGEAEVARRETGARVGHAWVKH